jgi:hypothetical protein
VVRTVLQTVLDVRRRYDTTIPRAEIAQVQVSVPDITEHDNASLAIGVQRIVNAFAPIYNARLVDEKEFIRLGIIFPLSFFFISAPNQSWYTYWRSTKRTHTLSNHSMGQHACLSPVQAQFASI